jgi:hypothetical protein
MIYILIKFYNAVNDTIKIEIIIFINIMMIYKNYDSMDNISANKTLIICSVHNNAVI